MCNLKETSILLLLLLLSNYSSGNKKNTNTILSSQNHYRTNNLPPTTAGANRKPLDSLKSAAKKKLGLSELELKDDTLIIVSSMDFLYYPFGHFKTINRLNQVLKSFKDSIETDVSNNKLNRMTYKSSFIKFFYDDEKKSFEIVSGRITDPEVVFLNNIYVGISKIGFINIFFNQISPAQIKTVKVIKIISGVDGIIHHYYFTNNILTCIKLDTDYLLDKN